MCPTGHLHQAWLAGELIALIELVEACIGVGVQKAATFRQQSMGNVAQIRSKVPKLAAIMDDAEEDVRAYMTSPKQHWAKLHSTTPSNVLTAKSSGAPKLSASFRTMKPSSVSSAHCSSSRTMNGQCNGPDT